MSAWLARPPIITEEPSKFPFPSLRLRLEGEEEPGFDVSPFTHILFQTQLCQMMSQKIELENGVFSPNQIAMLNDQLDRWASKLPRVFALEDPDMSLDAIKPWLQVQRPNLHAIIRMVQLAPLKAYVTKLPSQKLSKSDDKLRDLGVDRALKLLEAATALHDLEFPSNAQFCTSLFSIFDTGITLGAAIMHDRTYTLPRRQEALDAVQSCLDMLCQYSSLTKIGTVSYNFLSDLVRACPLLPQERHRFDRTGSKRRKTSNTDSSSSKEQLTPEPGRSLDSLQSQPSILVATAAVPPVIMPEPQVVFSQPDIPPYNAIDQRWLDDFFPWDQIGLGEFRNSTGTTP